MTAFHDVARAGCRQHGCRKSLHRDDGGIEVFATLAEAIHGFGLRRRTTFSAYLAKKCRGVATRAAREQRKQALVDPRAFRFKGKLEQEHRARAIGLAPGRPGVQVSAAGGHRMGAAPGAGTTGSSQDGYEPPRSGFFVAHLPGRLAV